MNRFLCLSIVLANIATPLQAAEKSTSLVGEKIKSFELTDARTARLVRLGDFKDRKAIVVVFIGTACPINNAQLIELRRLHKEYEKLGVQFVGINSNCQDKAEGIARHARDNEIPFPVLIDRSASGADNFKATRTPEVFVLDAQGIVRYHGRVNDQFDVDVRKLKATTRDLGDALDAIIEGKPVGTPETRVVGCKIARAPKARTEGAITFSKDVCRILQEHCQECHRPGQAAPMALLSYDDASSWAESIREAVDDRRMPPWYADHRFGHFSNDRALSSDEREKLLKWIDDGCPKGDDRDLPEPLKFPADEWKIGKPDRIFEMEEAYPVPAEAPKGGIPYQLFIIDPQIKEDVWVQAAEAKAGAPNVVHHILAFIVPPRERIEPDMPSAPFLLGVKNARVLSGTAPGDMPRVHQPGAAVRIPAGSKIVFQMHYTPNGKAQSDRSSVGVIFARKPPEREILTIPIYNHRFRIPPGASDFRVDSYFEFSDEGHILSFMPHMHLRGKDFTYKIEYPDGTEETVLSVPHFNFNWQLAYHNREPLKVHKGGKVHCIAHFDNSASNANNPDSTKSVGWGDQTWQEMMVGWMDMVYDRKPKVK